MKQLRISFLATALLFTFFTNAQSWCPPGATWVYGWQGGSAMLQYAGDTLLDGFVGQRIQQSSWMQLPWDPDSVVKTGGPDIITRTAPGLVLFWLTTTQEWDTLYWFSAQPGDKWSPGWQQLVQGSACIDSYLLVVDTSTTLVNGVALRTLELERHLNTSAVDVDEVFTIIERIGNTEQFLLADPPYVCFTNEAILEFRCYRDEEIRFPQSSSSCSLTLAVEEIAAIEQSGWSVSPIPFLDRFTVRSTIPLNAAISLLDMTGKELQTMPLRGSELEVDAGRAPSGCYILRMVDSYGHHTHRVVVKE